MNTYDDPWRAYLDMMAGPHARLMTRAELARLAFERERAPFTVKRKRPLTSGGPFDIRVWRREHGGGS